MLQMEDMDAFDIKGQTSYNVHWKKISLIKA